MYYMKNDTKLFYEIYGKKNKKEILILPGWGDNRKTFTDMISKLKDKYKIYINEVEKKAKRTDTFVQILIPTLSVPMIANGIYLYANGNESYGKLCIGSGVVMLVGAELVWNGGKFILKIW